MTAQILCVEDDPDVAQAIGIVLRGGGLEVSSRRRRPGRAAEIS